MYSTFLRTTLGLSLISLAVGCGDDTTAQPDARPQQADARDIDAPSTPAFKGYDADEGGEVRVEYVMFPSGGIGTRSTAFFYKNPGTTKYFDYLNLNGCTNMLAKDKWPMATNPIGERDYYDVGSQVVIIGGPTPLTIPKRTVMGSDPFARQHPANDWYFDPLTSTDSDGGTYLTANTLYDVALPGSAEFPAAYFDNVMYMPEHFTLTSPGHMGPLSFPVDTPQTFTWQDATQNPPTGVEVLSLLAFTGAQGPVVVCVEPDDGSITVPADLMNVARTAYPTGGTVARQTLTHAVRELVDNTGPTGRRIDFLGVWCYAGTSYVAP